MNRFKRQYVSVNGVMPYGAKLISTNLLLRSDEVIYIWNIVLSNE